MAATTYKKLAQLIRDEYYRRNPSDDANYDLRFFAELVAQGVAEMAVQNAIDNSNQGESTYANDAFISSYTGLSLLTRDNGERYTIMPATPPAMPNNQEIVEVRIEGSKCLPAIPMTSRQSFSQQLVGDNGAYQGLKYKVKGKEIIFVSKTAALLSGTVSLDLIGSVNIDELLSSDLSIPKNYEGPITLKILGRLIPTKGQPIDLINDGVPNPG